MVVSIDPRRVYVNHPDDVPYKVIGVTNPGISVFTPLLYMPCHGLNEHYGGWLIIIHLNGKSLAFLMH